MKFRKKPIIIEAEQWFPGKNIDGVESETVYVIGCPIIQYFIRTLEGKMKVTSGDWIIIGVDGERYCCNDSIFKKTYEMVD